jgi:hypothetical protein
VATAKSALLRSTRDMARHAVDAESGFAIAGLLKTHLTWRAFSCSIRLALSSAKSFAPFSLQISRVRLEGNFLPPTPDPLRCG